MKIATNLEQSKKLAEILPIDSADMMWTYDFTVNDINGLNIISDNLKLEENDIPAWSLSALLELMPSEVGDNHYLTLDKEHYEKGDEYCCCYEDCNGNSSLHVFANHPIDACDVMILKLKKKNLI